jgi:hypothetical protein
MSSCRHARIRLDPPIPTACFESGIQSRAACEVAKMEQTQRILKNAPNREKKIIKQNFYLWGGYPRRVSVDVKEHCTNGVYEIYQYVPFMDGLLSEITLGIYSPRTLELTCY